MITLKTRIEIVETYKIIRSELTKMQKAFFDDEMLQYYKDENEENLYWEKFDCLDRVTVEYDSHYKVIGLNYSDINTFADKLTWKLKELFEIINAKEFIIISHLKLDIFGNRDNNFKPLKKSYKTLENILGRNSYKEAVSFDLDNMSVFIEVLFWITRCDPSVAEYIYLFDKEEQIEIHICKYGNIHLTEFRNEQLTSAKLTSLGWTIIDGEEYDNFSDDGRIKGRQLKI